MTNPFHDENSSYLVLVNGQGQHCLWPLFAEPPRGWSVAHGPAGRAACLDYTTRHWTDLRPRDIRDKPADGEVIT